MRSLLLHFTSIFTGVETSTGTKGARMLGAATSRIGCEGGGAGVGAARVSIDREKRTLFSSWVLEVIYPFRRPENPRGLHKTARTDFSNQRPTSHV